MFNARMFAVLKRELKARIMNKRFVILTLLMPALILFLSFLPALLMQIKNKEKMELVVVSESHQLISGLKTEFDSSDYVQNGEYSFTYEVKDSLTFSNFYEEKKSDILSEEINGIIFIPDEAMTDKEIEYYSVNPNNTDLVRRVGAAVNRVLLEQYFSGKNITEEDLEFTRKRVDFSLFRVSKGKDAKKIGDGDIILTLILGMILYMSLLFMGSFMLQSVIEEKASRIVEVVLSSVSTQELMVGKILGNAITGLFQMFLWMLPVMVIGSNAVMFLPAEFMVQISFGNILYFFVNFLLGLLTFLGMFGAVGSLFDNEQDANSAQFPLVILILVPFYIGISLLENPGNPAGEIASILPFFSIIVMPIRMALIEVPGWQLFLALSINTITLIVTFYIAAKIYRIGILKTGKRPKWSEIVRWVKYKY